MDKTEYMNRLRLAVQQLSGPQQEQLLWEYEHRFVKAILAGQSETEVAAGLPSPELVAADFRSHQPVRAAGAAPESATAEATTEAPMEAASILLPAHAEPSSGRCHTLLRHLFALFALALSNLLALGPALALVLLLGVSALFNIGLYAGGIAVSAATLKGEHSFQLLLPFSMQSADDESDPRTWQGVPVQVDINQHGVLINQLPQNLPDRADKKVEKTVDKTSAIIAPHPGQQIELGLTPGLQGGRGLAAGCGLIAAALILFVLNCYVLAAALRLLSWFWRWQASLFGSAQTVRTA